MARRGSLPPKLEEDPLVTEARRQQEKLAAAQEKKLRQQEAQGKLPAFIPRQVSEHLSDKQIKEACIVFEMFDATSQECVAVEQLGTMLRSLGLNPTPDEISDFGDFFDEDETGVLDINDFLTIYALRYSDAVLEKEDTSLAFRAIDSDLNGYLESFELERLCVFRKWGPPSAQGLTEGSEQEQLEQREKMNSESLKRMIEDADVDGDGQVDYFEFVRMMSQAPSGSVEAMRAKAEFEAMQYMDVNEQKKIKQDIQLTVLDACEVATRACSSKSLKVATWLEVYDERNGNPPTPIPDPSA